MEQSVAGAGTAAVDAMSAAAETGVMEVDSESCRLAALRLPRPEDGVGCECVLLFFCMCVLQ